MTGRTRATKAAASIENLSVRRLFIVSSPNQILLKLISDCAVGLLSWRAFEKLARAAPLPVAIGNHCA
jgi:hypothetical protein